MKYLSILFITLVSLSVWSEVSNSKLTQSAKPTEKIVKFGADLVLKTPSVTVDEAIEKFKAKNEQGPVLLAAKIEKVCKKKGCWMTIKSKSHDVRVTFKDYGFFVPVSLVGQSILVEGKLTEVKLTLKETKHYVADEGGDPSKVTEPSTDYQFVATGLVVQN